MLRKLIYIILLAMFGMSCSSIKQDKEEDFRNRFVDKETGLIDTNAIAFAARNYVINGSILQMQEQYAESILEFQQALRFDENAAIYYAIAKSYKELNRFDRALENINKSLDLEPNVMPTLDLLVEVQLMKYELSNAIKTLEHILTIENSKQRRILLARLNEFDDLDRAIDIYEKILAESLDVSVLQRLSNLYRQNKQQEEYIESLKQLYEFDNQDPSIVYDIMDYYFDTKDYDNINGIVNTIDKTLPAMDLAFFYIAVSDHYKFETESNIDEYIKNLILKVDSRFYFNWYLNVGAGDLSLKIGEPEKAEKFYSRALKIADTSYIIPSHIAYSYFSNKYYQESVDIIKRYVTMYPDSMLLYYLGSDAYYYMNEYDKAIEFINLALKKDTNNLNAMSFLAGLYDKIGKRDKAFEIYEDILRQDKSNAMASNNYAYMLAEDNIEIDKALKMANIAISAEPENAAYLDTYGWVMFRMGNLEKAEEYILKAIDIYESAEMYEHLGDIYEAMGKMEKAVVNWEKALELEPDREYLLEKIEMKE